MRIPIESSTSYRGRNSRPNLPALASFLILAFAAGALGAIFSPAFSAPAARWYASLAKPRWLPPQTWFGPVWIALYVLMAVAAWIIWRERYHRGRSTAIAAYAVQLLLNALWAPVFFGLKNIGAGLFDIVALWLAVGWTMREFARVKFVAALTLLPYFLWMTFAAAINLAMWKLNP
ncbi:MAG TPA: TspO/MBR family protein [Steroidobacteraceae bacterium]|jgi:tryptophan-rich sensory protein|nr:TspO/MBR family protein [Steroidobacteraceae bacterium]